MQGSDYPYFPPDFQFCILEFPNRLALVRKPVLKNTYVIEHVVADLNTRDRERETVE